MSTDNKNVKNLAKKICEFYGGRGSYSVCGSCYGNKDNYMGCTALAEFLSTPKKILGNKVYSTATLKSWSKEELIEHIRILEHNWQSSLQNFENLSENTKILLEEVEKSTKEKTVKEVLDQCTELMRRFEWEGSTDICMERCEWEMNAERIAKDCFGVNWVYERETEDIKAE